MKYALLLLFAVIRLEVLAQGELLGLWQVDSVSVGEMGMTPNAKWVEFLEEGETHSGNGWTRHSVGTYSFEGDSLSIDTENGTEDEFGAFVVSMGHEAMVWTRVEEGQEVSVFLSRIEDLPMAYADEILGLWELKEAVGEFEGFVQKNTKLYFRPDNVILLLSDEGRERGTYSVGAHSRSLLWIPNDESLPRRSFSFDWSEDGELVMSNEKGDRLVFKRSRQF